MLRNSSPSLKIERGSFVDENKSFAFKLPLEYPLLFPREGGRRMSSKTAAIKNNVDFNLTLSR
jgi:hypothetical protein